MNKSLIFRVLFYTFGLSTCLYGYLSRGIPKEYSFIGDPPNKLLLMTYNGMLFTILTITLGVIILLNKLIKRKVSLLLKIHSFFSNVSFGIEIIVVLVYWPLNFIKPESINSPAYRYGHRIPFIKQMSIHVIPFFICLVEVLTCKIVNNCYKYIGMFTVCTCYFSGVIICCKKLGFKYPYGFLKNLNFLLIFILCYSLTAVSCGLIKFTNFLRKKYNFPQNIIKSYINK